jgi:hypothetical protein
VIEVLTFNGLIIYNNIIGKFFALALSIKIFQNIFQIDFSTQFLGSDVQFNSKDSFVLFAFYLQLFSKNTTKIYLYAIPQPPHHTFTKTHTTQHLTADTPSGCSLLKVLFLNFQNSNFSLPKL